MGTVSPRTENWFYALPGSTFATQIPIGCPAAVQDITLSPGEIAPVFRKKLAEDSADVIKLCFRPLLCLPLIALGLQLSAALHNAACLSKLLLK